MIAIQIIREYGYCWQILHHVQSTKQLANRLLAQLYHLFACSNDGIACLCEEGWGGFHCEFKENEVPQCTLECDNGGICEVGIRSSAEIELLRRIWSDEEIFNHMRCICPVGYGGPLCQAISEECGDNHCFHGGTCITTTTTIHGESTTEYHCDCTTAGDHEGHRFAGDYCQEMSTSFCDENDDRLFCTNGGSCHTSGDPTKPCECPEGFAGHKCEYDTRPSTKQDTSLVVINDELSSSQPCGNVSCFNGAECISRAFVLEDGTQGTEKVCDCTTAHKPALYQAFAGEACQYKSTSVCASSGDQEIKFCVNGGVCDSNSNSDAYCSCPIGWEGKHCEIHTTNHQTNLNPSCGDTVCYNGGNCVETRVTVPDLDGGTTTSFEHYCDCTTAFDGEFLYSGKSCEYKSTTLCTLPASEGNSLQGLLFCTNHGSCRQNVQQGCNCPDGFTGFRCEFLDLAEDPRQQEIDETTVECGAHLVCKNGGTCVSSIIQEGGQMRHIQHCDCSTTATDETIFAGAECEHEVTSFCTEPADGEGLESTIFCVQGGKCKSNVYQGCDCAAGWTGFRCEFPMDTNDILNDKYHQDSESNKATPCGDKFCYNGGVCEVVNQVNDDTGEFEDFYFCDCSTTATATEVYGGVTCSFKSTSICGSHSDTNGGVVGANVCLNNGKCRDDPVEGCDCPSGFIGTSCEFEVQGDEHANQGVPCGDKYCYNGGKCNTVTIVGADEEKYTESYCDCISAIKDDSRYAGDSCQYKATRQCTHSQDGESVQGTLFCVNGGTCRDDVLQGCDCPAGWTGFFCEFHDDTTSNDYNDELDYSEACGDFVCLNGGKCVSTTVMAGDGSKTIVKYCDCNFAYDENHVVAGPNCEYHATVLCTEPELGATNMAGVQFCVNGGKCPESNILGGCDCPLHWTGMRCEIESDEIDDDGTDECGTTSCLHGGKCVYFDDDDTGSSGCDCSTAFDDFHRYDGPFCQYQSTEFCSMPEGTLATIEFCVNNGTCQGDGNCRCPSGFYGSRCEMTIYDDQRPDDFVDAENDYEYNCRLTCSNGGFCAKGVANHGPYQDTISGVSHLNRTHHETYFEHCVCPEGFLGLTCEHKVLTCGNDEHYCLHGSTCVKYNDDYLCDCSKVDETIGHGDQPSVFAGDSCEHPANDICVQGDIFPTRPLYFCVNHGVCRAYVVEGDDDPGCNCPNGWEGPHCEIRSQYGITLPYSADETKSVTLISVVTVLVVAILFALVAFFLRSDHPYAKATLLNWITFRRRRTKHKLSDDPNSRTNNFDPKCVSATPCATSQLSVFSSTDPSAIIPLGHDYESRYNNANHDAKGPNVIECEDEYNDEEIHSVSLPLNDDGSRLHNVDFT